MNDRFQCLCLRAKTVFSRPEALALAAGLFCLGATSLGGVNRSAHQGPLPCLTPDSAGPAAKGLRFGRFTRDRTTGDVVGTRFTFFITEGHWSGTVTKAAGEIGDARPLLSVRFTPGTNRLQFSYPSGVDTTRFDGRFTCQSIRGQFAFTRTQTVTLTVRRVR
jgi:hypothetical protein